MNARPLTDAELAAGLRRVVPSHARADLRDRIRAEISSTPQQLPLPALLAPLADADPVGRRRALLLAAALLLVLSVSVAVAVGAWLNRDRTLPPLTLQPPADVIELVQTTYSAMPELPPLTLTAVEDGQRRTRVHVDAAGSVRIERYPTLEATEPESVTLYVGTSMGTLLPFEGRMRWYEQTEAISEDPRVFVYATIGQGGWGGPGTRCATVVSDPNTDPRVAASDVTYVGAEYVLGRPTYRVRCIGDRWIDVETRLVLRTQGPAVGADASGQLETMEVTELEFAPPPAALFALEPPPGVPRMSEEDYGCASDPFCQASPRPIPVPPAAPDPGVAPTDLHALVAGVVAAVDRLPPFVATFERISTQYPGSQIQIHGDGSGRYRLVESAAGDADFPPLITLLGANSGYQREVLEDGTEGWRPFTRREEGSALPMPVPAACVAGWVHEGVDLVAERVADRLACADDGATYWIDRELGIPVGMQSPTDPRFGTEVIELRTLTFESQPPELFELPEGAEILPP